MSTKVCTRCRNEKDIEDFPALARSKDGHDTRCTECINAYNREYYAARIAKEGRMPYAETRKAYKKRNPNDKEVRRKNDMRKYGITIEEYDALSAAQGGVCAICGEPERHMTRGVLRRLSVDHNHVTGKVRGLLCAKCNLALGQLGDTVADIEKVLRYLRVGEA